MGYGSNEFKMQSPTVMAASGRRGRSRLLRTTRLSSSARAVQKPQAESGVAVV
jgi:hypothetical protein